MVSRRSRSRAAKLNLTDVAARDRPRSAAAPRSVHRAAPRTRPALLRPVSTATSDCELPLADFANSNWHMFQILLPLARMTATRGDFIRAMHDGGIGVGVHYPAMHLFKLYRTLGWRAGRVSACRACRPQHRHAAALSRDEQGRRRAGLCRHARCHAERNALGPCSDLRRRRRCPSSFRSTTRRSGCRRSSPASTPRSTAWASPTRSCSSTTAAAIARRRCCASSISSDPTSPA